MPSASRSHSEYGTWRIPPSEFFSFFHPAAIQTASFRSEGETECLSYEQLNHLSWALPLKDNTSSYQFQSQHHDDKSIMS